MDTRHLIILLFMCATLAVLIAGGVVMMLGGKLNTKYGSKLMVVRVSLQALTVLLIGAMFLMGR